MAATAQGRLLGLEVGLVADVGAYLSQVGAGSAMGGANMYPGIYRFDAFALRGTGVYTNRTPVGAYRGAGRPEATFAIERILDELAAELEHRPDRAAPAQLDHRLPAHDVERADLRRRRLCRRHRPGTRAVRLRRPSGGAAAPAGRRRSRSARHRCEYVRRGVRGWRSVRPGRPGDGFRAAAADRRCRGDRRDNAVRHRARHVMEPARRGCARRAVRGRTRDPRRHGERGPWLRQLWLPVAGGRRRGGARGRGSYAGQGHRARGGDARGVGRGPRARGRRLRSQGDPQCDGDAGGGGAALLPGRRLRRTWPRLGVRDASSTRRPSLPAPTSPWWRSTRRPASCACSGSSRSTMSATS